MGTHSFSLATEYLKRKQDEECTSPVFYQLYWRSSAAQWARILAEKNRTHWTLVFFRLGVCKSWLLFVASALCAEGTLFFKTWTYHRELKNFVGVCQEKCSSALFFFSQTLAHSWGTGTVAASAQLLKKNRVLTLKTGRKLECSSSQCDGIHTQHSFCSSRTYMPSHTQTPCYEDQKSNLMRLLGPLSKRTILKWRFGREISGKCQENMVFYARNAGYSIATTNIFFWAIFTMSHIN